MNKKNIFSICVVSYNSEDTIIDTLQSILHQNYSSKYIELIISDDASSDNTKELIKTWEKQHRKYFYKIKLNIEKKNNGLVNNINKACKLATSEWIKPIAADDILMEDCISKFNEFICINKNACCIFCKVQTFNHNSLLHVKPQNNYLYNLSYQKQFYELLIDNFIFAPSLLIKKETLEKFNFFDSAYKNMEDYPLWLKLTINHIKLSFLDETLIMYRVHDNSLSKKNFLLNEQTNKDVIKCKKFYLNKIQKNTIMYFLLSIDIYLFNLSSQLKIKLLKNKKNKITLFIGVLPRFFSPLFLIRKLKSL
ncbi:hypothetical protein BBX45_03645 [Proteus mirabilis]|uniref:glycosyltransferase n=1 Tax=Proteus mirabilis TaxID=584 RepID=UPI0008DCB925|nr:glycosyltransferase [Proteus mirabilis]MBG3117472.1 glycosyltransferase [Proteus mirabilis]MDM3574836.1 glycosyltransferase [Proteus mirabilis]MDZ7490040.1 glycosyltransferase [Proteus mirabilis]OHY45291.1 hypothetical protein BBX45_03645 [Proteus mirabilis]